MVLPVGRSISLMWMAKSFSLESGVRSEIRVVVERYTFPSSSQNSCVRDERHVNWEGRTRRRVGCLNISLRAIDVHLDQIQDCQSRLDRTRRCHPKCCLCIHRIRGERCAPGRVKKTSVSHHPQLLRPKSEPPPPRPPITYVSSRSVSLKKAVGKIPSFLARPIAQRAGPAARAWFDGPQLDLAPPV